MSTSIPLLPLRDVVVFPGMVASLFVGRERSIAALESVLGAGEDPHILLAAQRKARINEPTADDLHRIGTVGVIAQVARLADGTVKVVIEGRRRARVTAFTQDDPFFIVNVEDLADTEATQIEEAQRTSLLRAVHTHFETYGRLHKRLSPEVILHVASIDDPGTLADTVAPHLSLALEERQTLLETLDPVERLGRLHELLRTDIETLLAERRARQRTKKRDDTAGEAADGEGTGGKEAAPERDEFKNEIAEIEQKIEDKRTSKEARERLRRELKKLKMMNPMSAEATVVRNYLDWILALPWHHHTKEKLDVVEAERVLDEHHYGLRKPKERILEHLSVQALSESKKVKGPILCLVGPPGVGKTSLARGVSRCTGRRFVRLSLGGVRDEAEIRGHRRTYIGALPGKIIQSLRKVGTSNPVFLLDEIDKMSTDFRGDPSAALLEVLDPEQNYTFNDHYLDLDYDLSRVLFITTANSLQTIPAPLQDRMEIIELGGYTDYDKLEIAKRHLLPRVLEHCGLKNVRVEFKAAAIKTLINHYTREAGVRALERELSSICRKLAKEHIRDPKKNDAFVVTPKKVVALLGPHKHRIGRKEAQDEVGLVTGLAVTMVGGDLLQSEVTIMPGRGKLIITGKLGEVMQESAQAAMSYVRSRAVPLGLAKDFYSRVDFHIHFPEGAIPKDGPSAGVTMATGLVSALTRIPVRSDVAMTGEITLRGRVLPIGGLQEKLLAAYRGGIKKVLIPVENERDLVDVPRPVLNALQVVSVNHADDVLRHALVLEAPETFLRANFVSEDDYLGIYGDAQGSAPATPSTEAH